MIKLDKTVNSFGEMVSKKLDNNTKKIKIKLSDIQKASKSVEEKYNPTSDEFIK